MQFYQGCTQGISTLNCFVTMEGNGESINSLFEQSQVKMSGSFCANVSPMMEHLQQLSISRFQIHRKILIFSMLRF